MKHAKRTKVRTLWLIAIITVGFVLTGCTEPEGNTTHIHNWGNWTVTTAATCVAQGAETRDCSGCDETETRATAINPTAHDMQTVEGEEEVAPTCTQTGFGKAACANAGCDHTENDAPIPALEHEWSAWEEVSAATCIIDGSEQRVCERENCDDKEDTGTETQVIPKQGHEFPLNWTEVTAATCAAAGSEERVCQKENCDDRADTGTETQPIQALPHTWGWEETTPATCLVAATDTVKCDVCGELGTQTQPGHSALGHSSGVGAIAVTCTTDGYTGGSGPCIREGCNVTLDAGTVIPKTGHHYHWIAPTCTTAGNSEADCTNCGTTETRTEGYAILGHNYAPPAIWTTLSINCGNSGCTIPFTLAQHIQDAPQTGTASDPVPLKVSINLGTMGTDDNGWTQLLAALTVGGKLVALDLSGSTRSTDGAFETGSTGSTTAPGLAGLNRIASIVLPNTTVTSIGIQAFRNCTNLTSVTIPNSVTSIGQQAFINCTGLTNVTIPDSVTSIDTGVFMNTGLTSITIPNSVQIIGQQAFQGTGLTSITIPNSVESIGFNAFFNCTNLTSVTFQRADIFFGDMTFPEGASLRAAYAAGGIGTYTRPDSASDVWAKQ